MFRNSFDSLVTLFCLCKAPKSLFCFPNPWLLFSYTIKYSRHEKQNITKEISDLATGEKTTDNTVIVSGVTPKRDVLYTKAKQLKKKKRILKEMNSE